MDSIGTVESVPERRQPSIVAGRDVKCSPKASRKTFKALVTGVEGDFGYVFEGLLKLVRGPLKQQSAAQCSRALPEDALEGTLKVESTHACIVRQPIAIHVDIHRQCDDAQEAIDFGCKLLACSLFPVHFVTMISE